MGLITKLVWLALPALAGRGVLSQVPGQGTCAHPGGNASAAGVGNFGDPLLPASFSSNHLPEVTGNYENTLRLSDSLQSALQGRSIPGGVAAYSVWANSPRTTAAYGLLSVSANIRATPKHPFVVASVSNFTLATLAGMIVSDGRIKWSTTVGEVLPDLKIPEYLREATLFDVCACSSGLPGGANYEVLNRYTTQNPSTPKIARLEFFKNEICRMQSVLVPVKTDTHGMPGYYTTAVMLESATGKTLEALVQEYFQKRLGLTSVGMTKPVQQDGTLFGFQSHQRNTNGETKVSNYPYDNLTNMYMSVEDLVKLGEEHLKAWFGKSTHLRGDAGAALFKISPNGIRTPAWTTLNGKPCLAITGDIGGCTSFLSVDTNTGVVFGSHVNISHNQGGMDATFEVLNGVRP